MNARNAFRFLGTTLVLLASTLMLHGASQQTKWSMLNSFIARSMQAYAEDHEGKLPSSWEDLEGYLQFEAVERSVNLQVRANTYFFGSTRPVIEIPGGTEEIVAMSANTITEERRPQKGRYVVFRRSNGIDSGWRDETVIQAAARKANVAAPSTGEFHDKSLTAAKPYEGPIPAPGAIPPPPPNPNAPYEFPYVPPKLGDPAPAPAPEQGTLVAQSARSWPWEMFVGLAILLAVIAVGVWRRKTHSH